MQITAVALMNKDIRLNTKIMGQHMRACIYGETVELNLTEWSGRLSREEAIKGIAELRQWLREISNTISDHLFQEAKEVEDLCNQDPCEKGHSFITYTVDGVNYRACTSCGYDEQVPKSWREQIVDQAIAEDERS